METVSVILNTYKNNPAHLETAVLSYLNQVDVQLQLIVATVKGDPSIEYVESLQDMTEHQIDLVIMDEPNIYKQINKALEIVENDWVCYASGNDQAHKDKCRTEIEICLLNDKKICYSAFIDCDENLTFKKVRNFHNYDYKKHLQGNFVSDCSMVRSTIFDKYGPFKGEQFGNMAHWDFWLRVFEGEGDIFIYNPTPTWNYRIEPTSAHVKRKHSPQLQKINNDARAKMLCSHNVKSLTGCKIC